MRAEPFLKHLSDYSLATAMGIAFACSGSDSSKMRDGGDNSDAALVDARVDANPQDAASERSVPDGRMSACPPSTQWHSETVTSDFAINPSVTVDSDGVLHILYLGSNYDATLASRRDGTWETTVIERDLNWGKPTALATSLDGTLHGIYANGSHIRNMQVTSDDRVIEDVFLGRTSGNIRISFSDLNEPHYFAVGDGSSAIYGRDQIEGWQSITGPKEAYRFGSGEMANDGRFHAAYSTTYLLSGPVVYAIYDPEGASWERDEIAQDSHDVVFALDDQSTPHVVYTVPGGAAAEDRLVYATKQGDAWIKTNIREAGVDYRRSAPTMALDGNTTHIAYFDYECGLVYAKLANGNLEKWKLNDDAPLNSERANGPSLVILKNGSPVIVHRYAELLLTTPTAL